MTGYEDKLWYIDGSKPFTAEGYSDFDEIRFNGVLTPVEMGHVFTVGDPWDNEVWLPSLFPKGTRVAVIRIGGDDE